MVTGENVGQIAAEAIRRGATDYVVKVGDYLYTIPLVVEKNLTMAKVKSENEQLRKQIERAMLELQFKNGQLRESLARVEQMAATDPLTGLHNRRHFSVVLEQMFAEAHRFDADLACVMIDLDSYKQLNDTFGHQVGDQLLIAAGKVISANLRRMDVAARYGGDEFVLLLPRAQAAESGRCRPAHPGGIFHRQRPRFLGARRACGCRLASVQSARRASPTPTSSSPPPTSLFTAQRKRAATASRSLTWRSTPPSSPQRHRQRDVAGKFKASAEAPVTGILIARTMNPPTPASARDRSLAVSTNDIAESRPAARVCAGGSHSITSAGTGPDPAPSRCQLQGR